MKVRILTAKAGLKAGQLVDMEDADAVRWLASGDAEKVNAKAGTVTTETADATPRGAEKR